MLRMVLHVGWVERSETQQAHPLAPPLQCCKVLGFTSFNPTYGIFSAILNPRLESLEGAFWKEFSYLKEISVVRHCL